MWTRSWPALLVTAILAGLIGVSPVAATDDAPAGTDAAADTGDETLLDGWQIDFVPYLWLPSIKGTSGVGGRTTRVDIGQMDLLDLIGDHFSLLAGMGHLEARHDRMFGFLHVVYVTVDTDKNESLKGIDDPDHPRLSTGQSDAAVEADGTVTFFEFGGGYRLLQLAVPSRAAPFTLDAIAGGRYMYFWTRVHATAETTIKIDGDPLPPRRVSRAVAGGGSVDWVDPFVGVRFMVPLTDDIEMSFRGDIGGFHAGSNLAWNIVTGLKYRIPWEPLGVHPWFEVGYKALSFDYDKGSVLLDLALQGPAVGIGLVF